MLYLLFDQLRDRLPDGPILSALQLLDQIQFRALAGTGVAFFTVLFFGRRVIAALRRMKIGDSGLTDADALRTHTASKANTPTMGGVLIAGAIALATLLLADVRTFYVYSALIVLVWLTAVGGVDDWLKLTAARRGGSRQGLYAWEKLVFQIGLGLIIGYFTHRFGDTEAPRDLAHVVNIPFQRTFDPQTRGVAEHLIYLPTWAFVIATVLVIAGMSNAVNITDGMDGLATGISSVVSLGLMVLCLIAGRQAWAQGLLVPYVPYSEELAVIAGAMAGACLGFLWWNCSPAQVFMGDTGSLCLGGLIGYAAIVIRQEVVILLMGTVFLIEIASVAAQVGYFRASGGKRIFRCAPYHHHLHLGGWTEQQVVVRAWIVSVLLVVLALASIKVR